MGFANRPVFWFSRHPTEPHGPLLHIRVCFSLFDFSHLTFSPSVLSQDSSNFSFPEDIASFNSGLWQPRQTRFLPIVPSPQVTWQVLHGLQSPQPCSAINDELYQNYQPFTYISSMLRHEKSKCIFTLRTHIWTFPFILVISFTSFPIVRETIPCPGHSSSFSTFPMTRAPLPPITPSSKSFLRTFGYIFINSANLVFLFIILFAFLAAIFRICFYWSAPTKQTTLRKKMDMELARIETI